VRSLWRAVQVVVDQVLRKTTLRDLLQNEDCLLYTSVHRQRVLGRQAPAFGKSPV